MADLEIRISAKDMGAGGALKDLQTAAGKTEGSLDRLGDSAKKASDKIDGGGRSAEDAGGRLGRVGDAADETEGKFTGLASGIDGVTSLMDDPSPQEFAQGLADIADGVGNFLIPMLQNLSIELVKNAGKFVANAASSVASAATSAAAHVVAAATVIGSWIAAGAAAVANAALIVGGWIVAAAQAAISAAAMAVSWLIAMGPALIIIALVMGAIALLIIHWDTIKAVVIAVWDAIWEAMKKVWDWISTNWPLILAILTGPIGLAVLLIVNHWDTIKNAFGAVKDFIVGAVSAIRDWIVDRIRDAVNLVIDAFNLWRDTARKILDGIVDIVTGMPGRITSAAKGMFNGITDAMRNALNAVISLWNNLSFTLPKINIPSVDVPGLGKIGGGSFGGQTFSTPNIPYLASGGTRSGLAMVGERGMELVDLGAGGHVIGANRTAAMMNGAGGSGSTVINIYVEGSIRSDRDLVKLLTKEIDQGSIPGLTRSIA